jgi:FkbM family methyltransferase
MKNIIRLILHFFGLEIHRYSIGTSNQARLMAMLNEHKIDVVIDVGANVGLFGEELRRNGYKGKIVAFEPLTDAHEKLLKRSKKDPLWIVAPRGAIGAENGEVEINIASNSISSSILPMMGAHMDVEPESRYIDKEKTVINTLDVVAPEYIDDNSNIFIKIDTQGLEHLVLEGAKDVLDKTIGLQLEMSFVHLYDGQILYKELVESLNLLGFNIWEISTVLVDKKNGRLLQVDVVLFRET